jgi:RNA polymerase sigma-70 factor (ECF subfamily)
MSIVDDDEDWFVPDATTVAAVHEAIEKLPDHYSKVVQLFLIEGYDHQEIAVILNISESASRTNLHRGKIKLKETLKHLQYGTGS